jgi:hypothetical protein
MMLTSIKNSRDEVSEHSITSPLTKDREAHVTAETVSTGPSLEQSRVVPPSLVGTIHVQELFILAKLKLNPCTLGIAVAVVMGKHLSCLLAFTVHI